MVQVITVAFSQFFLLICFGGAADLALSQKLAEELSYEQEASTEAEEPEFLTAFKKHGVWEVCENWLFCFGVY